MKEISPTETLSEDQAREYFIDIILGLEFCKLTGSLSVNAVGKVTALGVLCCFALLFV